jgi:hypothetical protein
MTMANQVLLVALVEWGTWALVVKHPMDLVVVILVPKEERQLVP